MIMKKLLALSAALAASGLCLAQDVGHVLSSTPLMQQVAVPRQVCSTEQVAVQAPRTGAGAAIGAIAGGALGSTMGGHGAGQAAATMIGAIGGAVVGDHIESNATEPQLRDVQRCVMQTVYETRAVGYNVVYEYAGKQYATQMPYDPGPTIQVQVSPSGASGQQQMAQPTSPVVTQQPVYVQQQPTVIVAPAVYPGYYAAPYPYYSPIGISLGFGYWGGGGHHFRR
jgi:uncharacterized protein YcfJ